MNPELQNEAQEMVYGEIGDFADEMMLGQEPDYMKNRAKPENLPGDDPAEEGVRFSDDDVGGLEQMYGAKADTNY